MGRPVELGSSRLAPTCKHRPVGETVIDDRRLASWSTTWSTAEQQPAADDDQPAERGCTPATRRETSSENASFGAGNRCRGNNSAFPTILGTCGSGPLAVVSLGAGYSPTTGDRVGRRCGAELQLEPGGTSGNAGRTNGEVNASSIHPVFVHAVMDSW
ncbi:hypothetical protein GUJ93_ZPchr0001g30113 [Zizania palustris]|uniref:Uncharacterized protein n=1 Tax=Zizania palustris TaxID=103762 RepID=A0A8J5RAY0_ZIZPA|nr:hypothetical protein GUJ93_ZPchr0001g30113 [Zizania palustris]